MMIKIYGTPTCSYCAKAKTFLEESDTRYQYFTIGQDVSKSEVLDMIPEGWKTVPIIFVGNKFIGGYDDLVKYIEETSGGYTDNI